MKIALSFLILLFCSAAFSAQISAPCNLTLNESPSIRGLRLGMQAADFLKTIPENNDEPRMTSSDASFILSGNKIKNIPSFSNLSTLIVQFKSYKIAYIAVYYDFDVVRWDNSKEFAANLSDNFKLPIAAWQFTEKTKAKMDCEDFIVLIDSSTDAIVLEKFSRHINGLDKKKIFKP